MEIIYDIPQTKVLTDTEDIQKLISCFSTAVYKKTSIAKTDRIFHIKLYLKNGNTAKILPRGNDIQINNLQFTTNSHFNNLIDKIFDINT